MTHLSQTIISIMLNIRKYPRCLSQSALTIYLSIYLSLVSVYMYLADIGMMVRVFAKGLGSIPGQVIPKTQKMVLDASLLNTQHYTVWIKGKVEQSRESSSTLHYTLV